MKQKTELVGKDNEKLTAEDFLEEGRSPYMEFDLPTGVLHEGRLLKSCVIREMTGEEEDILSSRKMSFPKKIQMIVERCLVRLGDVEQGSEGWNQLLQNLLVNDRTFLLIRIRVASLGAEMSLQVECPHCEESSNQTVSLLDFTFEGLQDSSKRSWSGELPRSKKSYEWRSFTVKDEERIMRIAEKDDAASLLLLSRLTMLDGKIPTVQAVKALGLQDRNFLRNQIKSQEGKIDDEIEIVCPSCGKEFKSEMEFGHQNFFFPSV